MPSYQKQHPNAIVNGESLGSGLRVTAIRMGWRFFQKAKSMREIKFRAWDGKEMHLPEHSDANDFFIDPEGRVLYNHEVGIEGHTSVYQRRDWILMQYTTLKDKNGKDIYADDLIEVERANDRIIVQCKFGTIQREMATGFLVDITGFYFERLDGTQTFPIVKNYAGKHDLGVFTVVGNVWEHPELLNQTATPL